MGIVAWGISRDDSARVLNCAFGDAYFGTGSVRLAGCSAREDDDAFEDV